MQHEELQEPPSSGPREGSRYGMSSNERTSDPYDQKSYTNQRASSPPRGRQAYHSHRDERYLSRSPDSRDRSASRDSRDERPPSRGRPSKEIMMEGLGNLTEDDVRYILPALRQRPRF